jgi:hypothetical protein
MQSKETHAKYQRQRYADNSEYRERSIARANQWNANNWDKLRANHIAIKMAVLMHYGIDQQVLQCTWQGCLITDLDMLTLDHCANDGNLHRKKLDSASIYRWAFKHRYPEGFQTLCANHQLKKELLRRRAQTKL